MTEILRMDRVDFVRDSRLILDNVSFAVNAGEHWALIGANGAGKSTILSMCGAEEHPTRGTVQVFGQQLGRVDIRELRESIGHVNPRHRMLSPLTVQQVVLTGATGTTELMRHWQPTADLSERTDHLIEIFGLQALRNSTWPTLSQGERGRTLIARALMPNPRLLLLDEPSTGLDVAAREQFLETIDGLHESQPELTTVLVTHLLEELPETTTHAMLIKNGTVFAAGDARGVLTTERVSEAFGHPINVEYRNRRWQARAARALGE